MTVTDHQAATLHALLGGDFDEQARLRARLDRDADLEGYSALIAAAFFLAADRRFAAGRGKADIVEFVAWERAGASAEAKNWAGLAAWPSRRRSGSDTSPGNGGSGLDWPLQYQQYRRPPWRAD